MNPREEGIVVPLEVCERLRARPHRTIIEPRNAALSQCWQTLRPHRTVLEVVLGDVVEVVVAIVVNMTT
jgi:hypothetical protein